MAIALKMYCIFLKSFWNPGQQNKFFYLFNLLKVKKHPCLGLHKKLSLFNCSIYSLKLITFANATYMQAVIS